MRHEQAAAKLGELVLALALGSTLPLVGWSFVASAQVSSGMIAAASAYDRSCPRVALSAIGRADAGSGGNLVVSLPNGDQRYAPRGQVPIHSLKDCHAFYAIRVERLAGKCWIDLRQVKTVGELEARLAHRPRSCPAVQPEYLGPSSTSPDNPIRKIWPAPRFDPDTVPRIGVVVDRSSCTKPVPSPKPLRSIREWREALKSPCMTIDTVIWDNSLPTTSASDDAMVVSISPEPGALLTNDHGNPRVVLGITHGQPPIPPVVEPKTIIDTVLVPSPASPIPPALVGGSAVIAIQALARRRRQRKAASPAGAGASASGRVRVRDDIPSRPGE